MSIFYIQKENCQDNVSLMNRLNYIRETPATCPDLIHTVYVSKRFTFDEFILVKRCWLTPDNNTMGGRYFFEFIISLKEEESYYLRAFSDCTKEIDKFLANFINGHYQLISAIHINTDNLHCHIIMNNIDFITGNRLQIRLSELYLIRMEMNRILTTFGFLQVMKFFTNTDDVVTPQLTG